MTKQSREKSHKIDKNMDFKHYYVYILTNGRNATLYTGVISDISKRMEQRFIKGDKEKLLLSV